MINVEGDAKWNVLLMGNPLAKELLESLECFGKLSTKRNDNGWFESSCCRKCILDSTKEG